MLVKLRNPDRTVEVSGPKTVSTLLRELDVIPETVLVTRDATRWNLDAEPLCSFCKMKDLADRRRRQGPPPPQGRRKRRGG